MFESVRRAPGAWGRGLIVALTVLAAGCQGTADVPRWQVFEAAFASAVAWDNPFQEQDLTVTFSSPSGRSITVDGFWDGGHVWRVRFAPDEVGAWSYTTSAGRTDDTGLHRRMGRFRVTAPDGPTAFDQHGPIRVAAAGTFLEHADGTPFFWLADTGWNAALKATPDEWQTYLDTRQRQGFTAVQWVATQWRAAPDGDGFGEPAFVGREQIAINPAFFQRLDTRVAALDDEGLLSVPVLLWAIGSGPDPDVNPGFALPEDQAIRLARYMVARWQGAPTVWILAGDGDYRGDRAERWRRIGRGVFSGEPHAPVTMHPGGMQWILGEFADEPWLDIDGYQSGHGDDERALRWITEGPATRDWDRRPLRPLINLEPPYEGHMAYQSRQPISAATVRRAQYWSLLNAPTAGVSYGGHGVWGWDDGSGPPTAHPNSGTPLPWRDALEMPGARQAHVIKELFTGIDFWRLRPAQDMLAHQPGRADAARFVSVSASPDRDLIVVYAPADADVVFRADAVGAAPTATWVDPRTGARTPAHRSVDADGMRFAAPADGDWVLLLTGPGGSR